MFLLKEKTKKIISIISILSLLVVELFPTGVMAADFISLDDLIKQFPGITGTTAGPINSADNDPAGLNNKQQGPKVDVTFNSEGGSQDGTMMTATAIPSFFNEASDPKKLYFTWYLRRAACEKSDSVKNTNKSCDLDGNDKIDENDWKIAAARIIVKGSFDKSEADYSRPIKKEMEESSGYEAIPSPKDEWEIDSDTDKNDTNAPNCYVQEPKTGLIYEMRRVNQVYNACPDDAAGNKYHRACVSNQEASCDVLNPDYTQANIDARQVEINAAIAHNADPVNINNQVVVPDQIVKTISNDFKTCAEASKSDDDFNCKITDYKNFKTTQECLGDGEIAMCVKDDGFTKFPINATTYPPVVTTPLLGVIFGKDLLADSANKEMVCRALAKPNLNTVGILAPDPGPPIQPIFLDNTQPNISVSDAECGSVKKKMVSGAKDDAGNIVIAGDIDAQPTCSFEKSNNMCKHLFPQVPKDNMVIDGKTVDMDDAITGDGKFTSAEKQFWGADPTKASTNGIGKDEENVVGLGVDKFSWIFTPGDQLGVVVEGDSAFPTGHADSSFKRMWAFSDNKCEALEDIRKMDLVKGADGSSSKDKRGFYLEGSGSLTNGFLTTEIDLNDCLEENLLDPDANNNSKLNIQLNASPQNPINDPTGKGDILTVVSGATNTNNSSGLLYKWSVQKSRNGSIPPNDDTAWMDITTVMQTGGSFAEADAEGLGKKDLDIKLNMKESVIADGMSGTYEGGAFYLKIKVKITGSAADGSQSAEGVITVRVNQQENEMLVYSVVAEDNGMLSLNKGLSGQSLELCADDSEKERCYVSKNQILGLEVPDSDNSKLANFIWTVNGNNKIICSTSISSQCEINGNKLFVPVLGNEGEAVDVIAKALNDKGESVEVSRHFVIGKAGLQIRSADNPERICSLQCLDSFNICPKYLGFYKDLGGGQIPDCSNQVWQTAEGRTVTLNAIGQTGFDWAVDGQNIPEFKDQNQIQLQINKVAGESYNIGLSTRLLTENTKQLGNIRLALYKHWGISPEDIVEQNQSVNVQLDVLSGFGQLTASAKPASLGASLITHLPEQLMFLLKISLTSMLLLLVTGLLFSLIPERIFEAD